MSSDQIMLCHTNQPNMKHLECRIHFVDTKTVFFFLTLFPGMGYLNNNLDHSPIFMHKHAGLVLTGMTQYLREGKILQTNSNTFPQLASQAHIPRRSSTNVL